MRDSDISGVGAVVGRDNHGPINVYAVGAAEEDQPYEIKKLRLLPLTERVLNLLAAIVGLGTFVAGWQVLKVPVAQIKRLLVYGRVPIEDPKLFSQSVVPVIILMALGLTLALLLAARRLVRRRLPAFPSTSLLPATAGVTDKQGRGRLAFIRFGGRCQHKVGQKVCGGKLRFYNKPTEWTDHYTADGRKRRETTERRPAAECIRNSRHWYEIDIADSIDLREAD